MFIKKLSKETINLISAGEVIEGPSDILKELLENSIDAKATEIHVEIKNSGIDFLQVKDNGSGITKEDLLLSLEKYATSKLTSIDELYTLESYGFRGEALSTIDAVSKLKIISSVTDDGKGYLLKEGTVKEVSSNKGTTIVVEDLFYNVPVRKKFLKSKSIEYTRLYEVFLASVLSHPEIIFRFSSDKKNIVFPSTTFENRLIQIYGVDIKAKVLTINVNNTLFKVTGVLTNPSNPVYFPSNFLFINQRFVFSPQIYKAITDAYKDYLMIQQKPFFILFITLDSKTVDVNVHPKKRVVKLENEMFFLIELKKELSKVLDKVLGKTLPSVEYSSLKDFVSDKDNFRYTSQNNFSQNNSSQKNTFGERYFPSSFSSQNTLFSNEENTFGNVFSENMHLFEHEITKVLGQIHNTFIVCETKNGLLLIDQHAADERINLEKNRLKFTSIEKQTLITSVPLNFLSEVHKEILSSHKELLFKLGYDYTFKEGIFYLTVMPLFLGKFFDKNIFLNILKDIEQGTNEVASLKDHLLKLKSCKESIKANDPLSLPEQITLITKLNKCEDKGICAHGRPTTLFIPFGDLEKLFKRIV